VTVVGLLSPGEMGAFVAAAVAEHGADVIWASDGRSGRSAARAAALRDVATVEALVDEAEVILSVCPPHAALGVAQHVAALRFDGIYLDANAVSPSSMEVTATALSRASVVDGSILGPPVAGKPLLYLAGEQAAAVAALFPAHVIEPRVLTGRPCGAASALKASFASGTKAVGALLLTAAASAASYDVYDELVTSWTELAPHLPGQLDGAAGSARKAWRFIGEMCDAADTASSVGLPDGYWRAAAETYRRLAAGDTDGASQPAGAIELVRRTGQPPPTMAIDVLFAAIAVSGLASSAGWYARLFGRDPDVLVNDDEVMWRVAGSGWLYVVVDLERAGRSVATVAVPDLDTAVRDLAARDILTGPIEVVGAAGRKAIATDPDGNEIALIEVR
jgi:predicted enzyme related to lactoylglutathione lyase